MAWIQKFYNVDIKKFANIDFDRVQNHDQRLIQMISDNQNLIMNAAEIQHSLKAELEEARWSFGKNMYNFFISQLDKII
jgi:DNA gyrase/topoisomerase IV subunit A